MFAAERRISEQRFLHLRQFFINTQSQTVEQR